MQFLEHTVSSIDHCPFGHNT